MKQELPLRCDGCAVGAPETTYSLPKFLPLFGGMLSTGFFYLCAECRGDLEKEGPGRRGALAIGRQMMSGNAQLAAIHGQRRKLVEAELTKYLERVLPKLTDPRPFKSGEDPLQAVAVMADDAPLIEIWCPSCGKPLKKGDSCHGHVY